MANTGKRKGNDKISRIQRKRKEAEASVLQYRRMEARAKVERQLPGDLEFQRLEKASKQARRKLQLNRLTQAQRRRSIRTMQGKIERTEQSIVPLQVQEQVLDDQRQAAERDLEAYRKGVIERMMGEISGNGE